MSTEKIATEKAPVAANDAPEATKDAKNAAATSNAKNANTETGVKTATGAKTATGDAQKATQKKSAKSAKATQNNTKFQREWFILRSLVSRDFKLKYRRSVLGVVWSILNPLLMMCVLTAVFSYMFKFDIENFPLYLILATTLFNFMSDSTTQAMGSILGSASLIKKISINKIIFPLEKVAFGLVNFVISLVAVAIVMAYFKIMPTFNILFVPLLLIYLSMFSLGIGLLLAAGAVFFRDFLHLWSVFTTAWMYATPLFYPVEMLQPWMIELMNYNPMYHYVTYFRQCLLYGTTPTLMENAICLGCGVVFLVLGYVVFKKQQNKFILYV